MAERELRLRIITPERVVYDDTVDSVVARRGTDSSASSRHAPMIALLGIGEFRSLRAGMYQYFAVHEGFSTSTTTS